MTYTITITEPGAQPVAVSLEWITEAPKVAGLYFAKVAEETFPGAKSGGVEIVEVYESSLRDFLMVLVMRSDFGAQLFEFTRWLGPLPMPPKE